MGRSLLCFARIAFARGLRCIGRARCRRIFLPIRFDFGRNFRTTLKIPKRTAEPYVRKMLIKQNKWMKALHKGWVVERNFWLCQVGESGELRMKVRLEAPSECTLHITLGRGRRGVASVAGIGRIQTRGLSEAGEICDPVGGDAGLWSCAHFARYNRTRLGDQSFLLLLACGYAPSKLTNQVEAAVVQLAS